jgi:sec-independent protein translocase protein TatC
MADLTMPLTAHLEELRWRIVKCIGAVGVGFAAAYSQADRLFAFLTRPLAAIGPHEATFIGTGVAEAFFTKLKVSFIAGVFAATPVILFQAWRFVAPGLYTHERRLALPFVLCGTLCFFLGAAFCYVVVFSVGYQFFLGEYRSIGVEPTLRVSEYLSFSARLLFAFGVTFELPVASFFLARIGLVTGEQLIAWSRYAVVVIFVVAAVLSAGEQSSA